MLPLNNIGVRNKAMMSIKITTPIILKAFFISNNLKLKLRNGFSFIPKKELKFRIVQLQQIRILEALRLA
jgi:hypothetical protein